ncbi:maleylpyruvate isomerase family mycothiol-dependent enzyme [Nonomuraea sp. NPDC050310]|uniref:maleylpyruvate isomerase family mycothiol-dependent enzyme n=1 Tax=Nonomuraea sp. NPDC050310 TaxID=3154935 RepID=UPI0034073BFD
MTLIDDFAAELATATGRLLDTAARLTDADLAAASPLPGWTRGHVVTHLSRNADSLVRLLTWARTGVRTPQYPSVAARNADIEAGAVRQAERQLPDLRDSAARLAGEIAALPAEAWSRPVAEPSHPAWYVVVRRLREAYVHHVDLDFGYGPADWPEVFLTRELHDIRAVWPVAESTISGVRFLDGAAPAAWTGLGEGPVVQGRRHAILAWLIGRSGGEGVTVVAEQGPGETVPAEGPGEPPAAPPWPNTSPAGLPAVPPRHYP